MKFKKGNLWIYITAAILPIMVFIIILLTWINSSLDYKEYKQSFADSISYAQDNDCLRAEYEGVSTKISYHNATSLYRIVTGGRFGEYEHNAPDEEPMLFDFGNGDTMKIWAKDRTTYLILYRKHDGTQFFYSTLEISRLVCLERLISLEWGNSEWDETLPRSAS